MRPALLALVLSFGAAGAPSLAQTPSYPDLVYATVGPAPLRLDLYLPSVGTAPYPLLIYIHGGGWSSGSKSPIPGTCTQALAQGFAVAALDYRLTSQAAVFAPEPVTFPAQIFDVKGAVRWLRANASTYQLDTTRFAAFGTSAGGHLCALLSTSGGVAALEGNVGGNLGFSSAVQAGIDFFGPIDLLTMNDDVTTPPGSTLDHDAPTSPESHLIGWFGPGQGIGDIKAHIGDPTPPYPMLANLCHAAGALTWLDANDPPMFIAHGTNDTTVPNKQSLRFSAALFADGVQHDFREIPGAGHGLGGPIEGVAVAFLREKLIGPNRPDAGVAFCAGDGSATACPCGNASFPGARTGCKHSFGVGANLNAVGVASIAADTLVLRGDSMPDATVLYFQGANVLAGGAGNVFGDGLQCVGNPVRRLGAKLNVQGSSQFPLAGDPSVSVKGGASAGTTIYYQLWFRDAAASCTAATYNLSNALAVTWTP